jgi:hypothetical protein
MTTASNYLMDVHGYDDDGDSNGEPERRQTHNLLACEYEQEGDSGLSFIRAMPTYELEQRLAQEFEFHTWLVLRQRQWTSQQCNRRVARHHDLIRSRAKKDEERRAQAAELRRVRLIETD